MALQLKLRSFQISELLYQPYKCSLVLPIFHERNFHMFRQSYSYRISCENPSKKRSTLFSREKRFGILWQRWGTSSECEIELGTAGCSSAGRRGGFASFSEARRGDVALKACDKPCHGLVSDFAWVSRPSSSLLCIFALQVSRVSRLVAPL